MDTAQTTQTEQTTEQTNAQEQAAEQTLVQKAAPQADAGLDWMPDKYRVKKEDGTFDVEASARKLAEGNAALAKKLGTGDLPPADADAYAPEITVEGFSIDELKQDDLYRDFAAKAHAAGMTNAQFSMAVNEFLTRAPQLVAAEQKMTADEAAIALRESYPTERELNDALADCWRATQGPDQERLLQKFGNDPDFIRFAASLGKEMREDSAIPSNSQVTQMDFETKASELRKQLEGMDRWDPKRASVQAELDQLYARRHGNKSRSAAAVSM